MQKLLLLGWTRNECMDYEAYYYHIQHLECSVHVNRRIGDLEWKLSVYFWENRCYQGLTMEFEITFESVQNFVKRLLGILSIDEQLISDIEKSLMKTNKTA